METNFFKSEITFTLKPILFRILYFLCHGFRENPTTNKKEIVLKAFSLINEFLNLLPVKNISSKSKYKLISRSHRISLSGLIYEYYIDLNINPEKKGILAYYQQQYHGIVDSVYPADKKKKTARKKG